MDEHTCSEDRVELKGLLIRPFKRARYTRRELSNFFADRTMDAITHEPCLREQLRRLYTGAALAERHYVPFTYEQFSWIGAAILYTMDERSPEHRYLSEVVAFLPEGDGRVEFKDISNIISNIDPDLYAEVRNALQAPRAHR